jgi:predicted GIY-YIG superfamily endonuclease
MKIINNPNKKPLKLFKCFPFKESLEKHMQAHVVYHLKCLDCDADYIGRISRQIERRFEEHKSGSKNENTTADIHSFLRLTFLNVPDRSEN